ncbi:methyltransferase, CheR family protein [Fictibacillus macauensis ZFHKF-1]|uniref:Methyltransferase, CheR family protein n=1 Tax=Fictibacillus macauensis ZFHKF-1 TaxID=1196324 RepID=I8J3P2_9BACL|nr:protein-glutamate O-methyltransferase CheR [Fictibacillus macauensis]EIT86391.1 methyltransferase, CheR family protein [Fictibacillus macauensis ZFHKF-1]
MNDQGLSQEDYLTPMEEMEIDLFLEAVYRLSGFDFRKYMRSSIVRRLQNRMRMERATTISSMQEKLFHESGFVEKILNDFSINVTEMFRDPDFFKVFRHTVVPELKKLASIRIWHAGCATGEEVYSMAILLKEEGLMEKTTIYATDMNEEVLEKAKKGMFSLQKMQTYTKNYLQAGGSEAFSEYYTADNHFAYFEPSLLKNIIFAQHNLVTDSSFNEFHVIICRNVLIYFTSELQNEVQSLFYESLCTDGFLGLGNKESLRFSQCATGYEEFSTLQKIYRKKH